MTNGKGLLDEALLRPRSLEYLMEISHPDENGRLQILQIHTNNMKESNFLAPGVNLDEHVSIFHIQMLAAPRLSQHYVYQMALCPKDHINVLPADISI